MTNEYILQQLAQIEQEHNVRILFAAETGSRAWGFASPDSDWDVRFIYVHPLEWYLQVVPERDVIEVMTDDGFDAAGWDIRKALELYRKPNLTFLEWINSPIIYKDNETLRNRLLALLPQYFNVKGAVNHYYHIAVNHQNHYLQKRGVELKRFLYYLRGLLACEWIIQKGTPPPVPFRELIVATITDKVVLQEVEHILQLKSQSKEHDKEIISDVLVMYGEQLEAHVCQYIESLVENRIRSNDEELNALLRNIILENQSHS